MRNFIISTEATSDLTIDIIEKYDIKVAPFEYFVDGYNYNTETNNMTPFEFYDEMRKGADVKTTQINYFNAKNFLYDLVKQGKDVLHICFSSGLSGTYENFKKAAEELNNEFENKCYVVDSLCASAGEGLLTLLVCQKAETEDLSIGDLVDYAEKMKMRINHIFTVDDLKYLVKGGRVSKGSAKIANFLHIKPIMNVDNDGKLAVTNKIFSRKLAIKKIFDKLTQNYDSEFKDILICQADCLKDATTLKNMITEKYDANVTIVPLDYLIGCHSGPGTMSVFYVGDKR